MYQGRQTLFERLSQFKIDGHDHHTLTDLDLRQRLSDRAFVDRSYCREKLCDLRFVEQVIGPGGGDIGEGRFVQLFLDLSNVQLPCS
jgi:hypothetical protein